jgi:hypothetical protein
MVKKLITLSIFTFFYLGLFSQKVGLGAHFGEPTGLTLRLNNERPMCVDILAAWDLDDYFFINVHGLWQKPLGSSPDFRFFYGPGVFAGFREKNDDGFLGFSGSLGLSLFVERIEIFGQITPRLSLSPDTDGDVGGGAGLRFYF